MLGLSMGVGRAILSLEADGLVDDQMARARVNGGADSEADDDACNGLSK